MGHCCEAETVKDDKSNVECKLPLPSSPASKEEADKVEMALKGRGSPSFVVEDISHTRLNSSANQQSATNLQS